MPTSPSDRFGGLFAGEPVGPDLRRVRIAPAREPAFLATLLAWPWKFRFSSSSTPSIRCAGLRRRYFPPRRILTWVRGPRVRRPFLANTITAVFGADASSLQRSSQDWNVSRQAWPFPLVRPVCPSSLRKCNRPHNKLDYIRPGGPVGEGDPEVGSTDRVRERYLWARRGQPASRPPPRPFLQRRGGRSDTTL